ncbi:MAG: cytochrome c3 family protein [Acidobacteria bacterium]|nr:cytochrome c3 family protein [Acidobacteriota bacterium]
MKLLLAVWAALGIGLAAKDTCLDCHSVLDGKLQAPAAAFAGDVHAKRGFHCSDCHGGDPNAEDPQQSMSRAKGYLGKAPRTAIPKVCARCHSDANLIHKFRPQQRVDQLALYQTSVHGKRLAAGDNKVATCIDCHSVHDIRETRDAQSPVHPLRLPSTCARCHASKQHMASYKIPTSQFQDYQTSVHWEALAKRRDLSAPSCATCHGNHGATPPEVSSVAAVCGTCHVLFEDLFNKSPHQPVFAAAGQASCIVCHSNHAIHKPSTAMLAGDASVCAPCHDKESEGGKASAEMAGLIRRLDASLEKSDRILERARSSGMEVSEALLRQTEAKEHLVKARVAVHAFNPAQLRKPVEEGLAIASQTYSSGEQALVERDRRRLFMVVSVTMIFLTLAGLWWTIRRIEQNRSVIP